MIRWAILSLALAASAWAQPTKPPEPVKSTDVTLGGLKSATPAEWLAQKPANRLRHFQFKLPRAEGDKYDAELFALDMQGSHADNITRLTDLFVPPAETPADKAVTKTEIQLSKAKLTVLDMHGAYLVKTQPIDKAVKETRPDYRMIAVIWESKQGGYTIRLIGPRKTVDRHAAAFAAWLKNFK